MKGENDQAFALALKLAGHGDDKTDYALATMYYDGTGTVKDNFKAAYWFLKSAQEGNHAGQYEIGRLFEQGTGITQDYVQAFMWLNIAAETDTFTSVSERNALIQKMTPTQLEEGQKLSRDWKRSHE
jgi:TPR repeat protein